MADSRIEQVFSGLVQRDNETPEDIIAACYDWYDGRKSAMLRFHQGQPVKASALMREANKAFAEDNKGASAVDLEQLRQLQIWSSRQVAMSQAAKDLREACSEFKAAVERLNLDPYAAEQVRREACGSAS